MATLDSAKTAFLHVKGNLTIGNLDASLGSIEFDSFESGIYKSGTSISLSSSDGPGMFIVYPVYNSTIAANSQVYFTVNGISALAPGTLDEPFFIDIQRISASNNYYQTRISCYNQASPYSEWFYLFNTNGYPSITISRSSVLTFEMFKLQF